MWAPRARAGRARAKWVLLDDLDQRDDLVARDPVGELRMIAAEMLQREVDELVLGLAAEDLAAIACDLPGHGVGIEGDCRVPAFRVCWPKRWSEVEARGRHLRAALRALRCRTSGPPRRAALPQPAGSRALRLPRAPTAARSRPPRADRGDLGRRAAGQPCLGAHRAAVKAARRRRG